MGCSYQCLHDGVVGGVHVSVQGEGALSVTVVGCVAFRSNDPVLRRHTRGVARADYNVVNKNKNPLHTCIMALNV